MIDQRHRLGLLQEAGGDVLAAEVALVEQLDREGLGDRGVAQLPQQAIAIVEDLAAAIIGREEAPAAYKDIGSVIDVQVEAGIVAAVARMRPLLTFKA